jgi:predicted ribosomally synthesized peptide with SipW-like signal peptide
MKKVIAWLLVLSLTAAISIGATLAYLTDTDEDVNVMTLGKVKIDQLEYERVDVESKDDNATVQEFHDNKPLLPAVTDKEFTYIPGDTYVDWDQIGKGGYTSEIWNPEKINNEVDKMVFIKNKGDYDAFVRSVFAFEAGKYATLAEFQQMVHLNLNKTDYTWEWFENPVTIGESTYFVATATYNKVLTPGALTEISLSQIALDKTATNEDVEAFGDTYQILVKSQAIQADGFDNAAMALDEGFGKISTDPENVSIPWENDTPTKGIDLKKALHNLDGEVITTKVKTVTFGLTEKHAAIAAENKGVLVDVEQDVPVYAYYVPDGSSNYDVYFLAGDAIYTPKNSSELFMGMTALTTVDTTNLDVSRTENMSSMFKNCAALANIDISKWNVGNVTNMQELFRGCKKLTAMDLSGWDTSKVKNVAAIFRECSGLTTVNASGFVTDRVTTLYHAFILCSNLQSLDTTGWDTSNVTTMFQMFYGCKKLPALDVSGWDTSNVTSMRAMFYNCTSLKAVDVSNWDTGKVTDFAQMFATGTGDAGNMKFTTLDVSNWDTSSATVMNSMFYGCGQLTELDLSGWDVSNVTTISHMFADCFNLQSVNFTGWNTSAVTSMDGIFNDCRTIKEIDVSHFDTGNCVEFSQMFEACYALEKIVGMNQWDTSKANVFDEMFRGSSKLKEVDLSSFNTSSVKYSNVLQNGEKNYHGYGSMFSGTTGLQKLILGEKFVFAGDGSIPAANYPKFPNPAAKEGLTAMWRNVATGERYLAKDIPEGVAATYVADYEYTAKGAKLVDALHYLNANTGSTKITDKVTSVTFGLTSDYAQIASTYTGVLADQEQDGPVYAYYVPNGSNYDVYLLSDATIYAPTNSADLFANMKALVKADTAKLDVSRVQNMSNMFLNCNNLTELAISNWNTGNVTNMRQMFRGCSKLVADVGNFDVSKVTDMYGMFNSNNALTKLDLSNWQVGNVQDMGAMFASCFNLTDLNVSNWDTRNVTTLFATFQDCRSLSTVDVSGWKTPKLTNLNQTFQRCYALTELDPSGWDVSKVTNMMFMFRYCPKLAKLDVSTWDTGNVTDMGAMFKGNYELEELDVSNWDVSKVTTFANMFASETQNAADMKLKKLDVSKWNPVSATDMGGMFYGCGALTQIDMSNWNLPKLTTVSHMFADCHNLEVIDVSGWKTPALTILDAMFNDCRKLKEIDMSSFDTSNVTIFGQLFEVCYALEHVYGLENWNTAKGNDFSEMFSGCGSLKELNLSSFNTLNANSNPSGNWVFLRFMDSCTGLEKITFGPNFSFDGIGTCPDGYKFQMPAATGVAGWDGKWYNAETGVGYLPSEIPEQTAATYVAVKPANP